METKLYTQLDDTLIADWHTMWSNSPNANYSNSPQWFLSALDSFTYKDFKVLTMYKKKQLVAVAAFVKQKKYGIDFYIVPPENFVYGSPFLLDYNDSRLVSDFIASLEQVGNIILENIPEELVIQMNKKTHNIKAAVSSLNYYLDIPTNSEIPFIQNRKKLMYRVRKNEEQFILNK